MNWSQLQHATTRPAASAVIPPTSAAIRRRADTTPSSIRRSAETRTFVPLQNVEVRSSGADDGAYTITGMAAVFNRLSLDLGGFREKIDPGAFARVLSTTPHVVCDWDHDTGKMLGSTANRTLDLKEQDGGLRFWAKVAPTSYAADLRILLERGDISQASFMFTIERERWEETDDGIVATIEEIDALYDVTVTARGAYPDTTSTVAHARSARLEAARAQGLIATSAPVVSLAEHREQSEREHADAVAQARRRRAEAKG